MMDNIMDRPPHKDGRLPEWCHSGLHQHLEILEGKLQFKCNLGLISAVVADVSIGFDNFDDDNDWIFIFGIKNSDD